MRIEERLRESAARYGTHPAVVAGRGRHSYADLDIKSERLAAALQAGGVAQGDRVVVFMDDGWEAVISLFAVLKAGGVLVPVATSTAAEALAERLQKSRPVAVVTQSRLAAPVATAIASLWSVKLVVLAGGDRARAGGTCIAFEETVGRIGRVAPLAAAGSDGDPAVIIAGEVPLSHCQLAEDAAAAAPGGEDMAIPPLAERAGLSRLLAAIAAGRTMIVRSSFVSVGEAERRAAPSRPDESHFGFARLLDGAMAGGTPVYQR
jgi:long-chain acyl-CoA synthetase